MIRSKCCGTIDPKGIEVEVRRYRLRADEKEEWLDEEYSVRRR
jgi:hypothetical protein